VLGWPGQWAVFWVAGLAWKFEMGMGLREEDPTVAVVAHLGIETSIWFETSIWVGSGLGAPGIKKYSKNSDLNEFRIPD
jgi:hypothetical protein